MKIKVKMTFRRKLPTTLILADNQILDLFLQEGKAQEVSMTTNTSGTATRQSINCA